MNLSQIIVISIVILGFIAFFTSFFTCPRYRILEVEHKSGEIDYSVQVSYLFGLPGTWVIKEICMGYYILRLKGCDLKAAKRYVTQFEEKEAKKRGYKVKKKKVIERD